MQTQIEWYLEHFKSKNVSSMTLISYQYALNYFSSYCEFQQKYDLKEITLSDLQAYHRYLLTCPGKGTGTKLTPNTLHLKLRIVKKFFSFLENRQYLLVNPSERFDLPLLRNRLPKSILTEQEILSVLKQPNIATTLGLRDRAIMELLYSTGLRRKECVNLTIFDVDVDGGIVRVNQGKRRKDRVVPLGRKACDFVRQYLLKSRPKLTHDLDCKAIWVGLYKKPLEHQNLNLIVKKYGKRARIQVPVTVHTFRRSAVTHMLRRDAHPLYLQRLLGHSTGETLRQYVKVSGKDLKDAHQKTHPRERSQLKKRKEK